MPSIDETTLANGLYYVSVTIGHARDIPLRALDVLAAADVLVAEDTRSLRKLMDIHGIALNGRRVLAYHDHNGPQMRPKIMSELKDGRSVAYASEAGTPLIADPGFVLGRAAVEAEHTVYPVPGASAVLAALTASALPTDMFLFAGFAPAAKGARSKFLEDLGSVPATLVFYESPKRLNAFLQSAQEALGDDRQVSVCRELTKKFEEIRRGTFSELLEHFDANPPRGEIVICVAKGSVAVDPEQVEAALREALQTMKLKAAANSVAETFGLSKRDVYQMGLELGRD
ncbi:MAG: 16S rRNA (cytidine(1402)-2'-O)-methyltransferase [Boseongicola sp.]|nr:16S rRNA (cytidine(1402)-2'-O)-methyltransferase [Boseongicola sp.]